MAQVTFKWRPSVKAVMKSLVVLDCFASAAYCHSALEHILLAVPLNASVHRLVRINPAD
jgi:hypothetical protein